jgi:23S rRNA (guanosine2251-2'-O)-methyltransferase
VWGRRPVEVYLSKLVEAETVEPKSYALHIIVDKSGKAPAQLRTTVELAKSLGLPVHAHKDAEEGWPIASDEEMNHQRVCLKVPKIDLYTIEDAIEEIHTAQERGAQGCVGIILDQVQDPRNFGAILRSAAFFGQKFVVFASDRQAAVTPHVLKTSAGGAFQLKLIEVVNLNRALEKLKASGAWIVGTTLKDAEDLASVPKDRPYVVVLGNESRGLRQEVARQCDYLAKISGGCGPVESLNVAVAAGVVLHALADATAVVESE